jgi:site-specific DNA recombinase
MAQRVAIYARYSTDEQRPTSIEDQIRTCRNAAERLGLIVEERFIFTDSAISGAEKGFGKRAGFARLMDAINTREVDVVIFDSVARAARNYLQGAQLSSLVESIGLRIVTLDGIDSIQDSWDTLWQCKLMNAVGQVKSTSADVQRGMLGQLKRGFQIAQPPFGYTAMRVYQCDGSPQGTRWNVEPVQAAIVREMYDWRRSGMSVAMIARRLNADGLPIPRPKSCKGHQYWRPATVHRILGNRIYKGEFVWNGSSFALAKARRKRQEPKLEVFARPDLRLVSDEVWMACNASQPNARVRGGGKHALAGILKCGVCKSKLSIGGGPTVWTISCPQCEQAKRVGGHESFIGYSSLTPAKLALDFCLQQVFSGPVLAEFHNRLRERMLSGPGNEEAELRADIKSLEDLIARIKRFMRDPKIGDDELRQELGDATAERQERESRLNALLARTPVVTKAMVEMQEALEPFAIIRRLIDGEPEVYKVRATLGRLIKRFELVAKLSKNVAVFELEFVPGICVAELTSTQTIDSQGVVFRVTVSTTARRPVVWTVQGERV